MPEKEKKIHSLAPNQIIYNENSTVNSTSYAIQGTMKIVLLHPDIILNDQRRIYYMRQGPPHL